MKHLIMIAALLALAACSSTSTKAPVPPAPGVKIGKPYEINGETYTPQHDPEYDETGIASWYGPGFHGRYTANGEIFDQDDMTAAHTTLPLPSLVRVTNIENGKSQIVRINDRGPFKSKRIIDLSRGSARALGVTGLAKVRVQFLREETESYWASRQLGTPPASISIAASNKKGPESVQPYSASTVTTVADAGPIGETAPLMSVSASDVAPPQLNIRPVEPRFSIVSDAAAAEPEPAPAIEQSAEAAPPASSAPKFDDTPVVANTSPQRGWYVQAGAFSSADNANALARRLGQWGAVQVSDSPAHGRSLHRVKVGPLSAREAAEDLRGKMLTIVPDARIIQE